MEMCSEFVNFALMMSTTIKYYVKLTNIKQFHLDISLFSIFDLYTEVESDKQLQLQCIVK